MDWTLAVTIAVCLLMEGFFTGAEMVLVAADRHRLAEAARRGVRGAEVALAVLSRPERVIATTLSGTNLFIVLSTVVTTSHLMAAYGERAEWMAVALLTPLVVLFGEIVPKSLAQRRANTLIGPAARFVRAAEIALFPLVALVSGAARLISAPFGGVPPLHGTATREELRLLLQVGRVGTDMEDHEKVMVRRVFHFGEKTVADVFRPLGQVLALPEGAICRDAALLASRSGFSRYPVFRDRVDHVIGFVHILDVVGRPPETPVLPLLRKTLYVPELMAIDELMRKFREAGTTFAVAVDEYGGVTGIVTAEDVIEEVVGEIEDEYDKGMDYYRKTPEGELVVSGRMEVGRLAEALHLRLPEGEYATVGGMLTSLAGRIPLPGDVFEVSGARFLVERASERAVLDVRVRRPGAEEDASPPGGD